MRGAILYGLRDVRFEERDVPKITKPTDTIIRTSATCVCGSDLWPYRGINPIPQPTAMGHAYCGIVEEVGSAVQSIKPGQCVIGSYLLETNPCGGRTRYSQKCTLLAEDRVGNIVLTGHPLRCGLNAPPPASQAVPGVFSEGKPCSNDRSVGERTAL